MTQKSLQSAGRTIIRYERTTNQSVTNGVRYQPDTLVFDTKNEVVTGASWLFTPKEAGYYMFSMKAITTLMSVTNSYADAAVVVNGIEYKLAHAWWDSASAYFALAGSCIVSMSATDTAYVRLISPTAYTSFAVENHNILEIVQL